MNLNLTISLDPPFDTRLKDRMRTLSMYCISRLISVDYANMKITQHALRQQVKRCESAGRVIRSGSVLLAGLCSLVIVNQRERKRSVHQHNILV